MLLDANRESDALKSRSKRGDRKFTKGRDPRASPMVAELQSHACGVVNGSFRRSALDRARTLTFDSSRTLNCRSNFLRIIRIDRQGTRSSISREVGRRGRARTGEATMARAAPAGADTFFQLGMMYSIGRSAPVDLVSAHKWFNIAALRGNPDAIRLRREVADQMSEGEIAEAQRAARTWLTAH
jgi:uncharacterized protein